MILAVTDPLLAFLMKSAGGVMILGVVSHLNRGGVTVEENSIDKSLLI